MVRVATTNYSAVTDTQFQWATADSDQFDRELDLYRLAQALEFHTHDNAGGNRGLPVSRIAANIVAETNLQDSSVSTNKIQNSAVTQIKIASSSVSRDKLVQPWSQNGSNDMNGGLRMRETTVTYEMGFFQATNGLAVFGTGPISGGVPPTQFILGQNATASFGASHGASKVNIMQTASNFDSGLRLYNANPAFFTDFVNDGSGNLVVGYNGGGAFWVSQGRVCVGNTITNFIARLNVEQTSQGSTEGVLVRHAASGTGRFYVGASGAVFIGSETSVCQFETASATFAPASTAGVALGRSGLTWGALFCTAATVTSLTSTGNISGPVTATTISASGLITASAGISVAAGQSVIPATNDTGSVGTGSNQWQQIHAGEFVSYEKIYPNNNGIQTLGDVSNQWARVWSSNLWAAMSGAGTYAIQIGSGNAAKPGSNVWDVVSDSRTKLQESIRDYSEGLNKILKLRPIFYRYNGLAHTPAPDDQEEDSIGFIAEEAQAVAPELVRITPTRLHPEDEDEDPVDVHYVNTHALTFMFVNAFKELVSRIEALENRS